MEKIVLLVPSLRGGGAERVITLLSKYLDKEKYRVFLMLVEKEGPYLAEIPENVTIVDLKSTSVRKSYFKLINSINKIEPEIIMSTMTHMNVLLMLASPFFKRKPKIVLREANSPKKSLNFSSDFKKKVIIKIIGFCYSKADVIIAQCNDMREEIIEIYRVDNEKVKTIYNPVDIKNIRKKMIEYNPYLGKKYEGKKNIVAVGRLTKQKGYDILINSFNKIVSENTNYHLHIIGTGELEDTLKKMTEKLKVKDKVTFHGFIYNPYPFMHFADLYIMTSRWEGFPNTLLEALACDQKVLALDCKTGPMEILDNGKYGTLVSNANSEVIAKEIIRTIREDNKNQDRASYFALEKQIIEFESLFDMILAK